MKLGLAVLVACMMGCSGGSPGGTDDDDNVTGENGDDVIIDPLDPADAGSDPVDPVDCEYPTVTGTTIGTGLTMPKFRWTNAYDENGREFTFDLEEFYCSDEYDQYTSISLVIGAGWCPNCPDYVRNVNSMAAQLEDEGSLIVYLEVQDTEYNPSTGESANEYINGLINNGRGIRIGDGESNFPSAINNQRGSVPSGLFIRRRDMHIVADQDDSPYILQWDMLAADPEQEWQGQPDFTAQCTPDQEEPYEPNDEYASAPAIAPGTFTGGICTNAPDFFRVELTGAWQLDLLFSNAIGDLDLHVVDSALMSLARSDSVDDDESLMYTGPATVAVIGYNQASAPYTLTLTELATPPPSE